jgi:ATP synthase protein I
MTDPAQDNGEPKPASELTTVARKVAQGSEAMDFISSVVAGLLLGLGLDWWIGTRPAFTIVGIVLGFVAGFFKLWQASSVLEEQAKERRRV